jgi:hypothetical protein
MKTNDTSCAVGTITEYKYHVSYFAMHPTLLAKLRIGVSEAKRHPFPKRKGGLKGGKARDGVMSSLSVE